MSELLGRKGRWFACWLGLHRWNWGGQRYPFFERCESCGKLRE